MKEINIPEVKITRFQSSDVISTSSNLPNENWDEDEYGNIVNPGGKTPPGHNKHNNSTDIW